jgi:hypothetical protein
MDLPTHSLSGPINLGKRHDQMMALVPCDGLVSQNEKMIINGEEIDVDDENEDDDEEDEEALTMTMTMVESRRYGRARGQQQRRYTRQGFGV